MRGAYFLIDSTVSIFSPPVAARSVVIKEMPAVTVYDNPLRAYSKFPANSNWLTPFPESPLEIM